MLIYDDIRFKLNNMKPRLADLRQALDLDKGQEEIAALEKQSAEPGFWDDPANSQKVLQRIKQLKDKAAHYAALTTMYEDVVTTIEMAEEMEDESLFPEVQEANTTPTTPSSASTPAPAGPRPWTGRRCWCGCISTGPTPRASNGRCWTSWTARTPA